MIIMQIFTVYDSKAEAYLPPFYAPTVAAGLRSFMTVARDNTHDFHINASDYTLFHIGEFDSNEGTFTSLEAKVSLGSANQFSELTPN